MFQVILSRSSRNLCFKLRPLLYQRSNQPTSVHRINSFIFSRNNSTNTASVSAASVSAASASSGSSASSSSSSSASDVASPTPVSPPPAPDSQLVVETTATCTPSGALSESTSTLVASDYIPPAPEIPLEFETVADLASATSTIVYNAAGEPTFQSIGLGSWYPPGIVQSCLEYLHIDVGLPWWGAILAGTICIRLLMFPLVVKSQRNGAKMANNMPQLQVLQLKMSHARQSGDAYAAAKYANEMMLFMKEKEISPFKSMLTPLAMAPVFLSVFMGLRAMANLPVDSLRTGGLFWFTDLSIADPYYLLPLITSTTLWITLEIGADGVRLSSSPHGNLVKYAMRIMPVVIFPLTMNFPAALLCYWASTNAVSLCQVALLRIPAVREKLKIEKFVKHEPSTNLVAKKGFKESLKDSWTNMKITREVQDRERFDEVSFKRAGSGPVPSTFKYDPTKAPSAAGGIGLKAKAK